MSLWQFLAGLREFINLEKILSCRAMIKMDINFWKEGLKADEDTVESEKQN